MARPGRDCDLSGLIQVEVGTSSPSSKFFFLYSNISHSKHFIICITHCVTKHVAFCYFKCLIEKCFFPHQVNYKPLEYWSHIILQVCFFVSPPGLTTLLLGAPKSVWNLRVTLNLQRCEAVIQRNVTSKSTCAYEILKLFVSLSVNQTEIMTQRIVKH